MHAPVLHAPRAVAADTSLIASWLPLPGLGLIPCNSFVIRSAQPVLVDTGVAGLRGDFLAALGEAVDPADLRWIWIPHMDADHIGNLAAVLELAPKARVVTNYLGMGKMGLLGLPQDRAYLLNPGQALDVGDRKLRALRPPSWDAPETTALFDERTRAFFCVDAFGAIHQEPSESAAAIPAGSLAEGMALWTSVDQHWLGRVDRSKFDRALGEVDALRPDVILGSHLPPASGITQRLLRSLRDSADVPAFVGPDQAALEAMMSA
ncbi:MBL fold metallo-hydrolase [Caenimonas aquaedulcis]|uniref:MBL fold metallo-hydrolase n=1 Tax=Caenimonas aquaedulcis TaxID=2793270 RepID=A0A931H7S9_9BURK|nr:MBL fold metallo-hydrolase [Caenimonas aquaedulcis]MBG9390191.1 MBL fold metallo-hydrolase [Caenimonas aquaedulcis]